jgi:hypothetical protein
MRGGDGGWANAGRINPSELNYFIQPSRSRVVRPGPMMVIRRNAKASLGAGAPTLSYVKYVCGRG